MLRLIRPTILRVVGSKIPIQRNVVVLKNPTATRKSVITRRQYDFKSVRNTRCLSFSTISRPFFQPSSFPIGLIHNKIPKFNLVQIHQKRSLSTEGDSILYPPIENIYNSYRYDKLPRFISRTAEEFFKFFLICCSFCMTVIGFIFVVLVSVIMMCAIFECLEISYQKYKNKRSIK